MNRKLIASLRKAAAGEMGGMPGVDPAADPASGGGAPPPADPAGGMQLPGVAPEPPAPEMPSPMGAGQGMPGQQPSMPMAPQAPKVKIDPGTVIIQCVRMMSAVLEKLQGEQNENIDPGVIASALSQAQNSMTSLVQQGEGGKPKVDINNGLVIIQKLSAALVDAMGIPMPASHMVATPDEMMAQGGQQPGQPPADPAATGGDPNAAGGGMPVQPIQPIDPLSADGSGMPKAAGDRAYVEPGVAVPRHGVVGLPAPLNVGVLQKIRRLQGR